MIRFFDYDNSLGEDLEYITYFTYNSSNQIIRVYDEIKDPLIIGAKDFRFVYDSASRLIEVNNEVYRFPNRVGDLRKDQRILLYYNSDGTLNSIVDSTFLNHNPNVDWEIRRYEFDNDENLNYFELETIPDSLPPYTICSFYTKYDSAPNPYPVFIVGLILDKYSKNNYIELISDWRCDGEERRTQRREIIYTSQNYPKRIIKYQSNNVSSETIYQYE